ncbi:MAG: Pyrroline-5-carboxylate reductase [Chloroflexi bacterium ADurb.Bin325]|nr:MAG: Pyrroline-5-carboxylate reductase [Chloroflexi bacterium ADurb.Bin325]
MLLDTTLSFIGSGAMAEAMIKGILTEKLIAPRAVTDNRAAARHGHIVVLSVKPQTVPKVLPEICPELEPDDLVISIVAGTPISVLRRELNIRKLVRAMPNTPGQVGQGITVWTATPEVDELGRRQAQAILSALGREINVNDEGDLDRATALSGTGPAYVFLFMEALIDAGVHMGFSRRVAQELVYQTIEGSVAIARETGVHPVELRNRVTSPGGTTAEALYQLEKGGLRTVISRAVWAAYQRSKSLGELAEK